MDTIEPDSWADIPILTPVPKCAGECRFVRVIRVLDASWTRTCVALVLATAARPAVAPAPRTRRCHVGTRACPQPEDRLPSAPAGLPAIPFYPLLGQAENDPP